MLSFRSSTREEIEIVWLSKLDAAQQQYRQALKKYHRALEDQHLGITPAPDGAFAATQAAKAQTAAHAEYTRVLDTFFELIVQGKVPKE